MPKSRKIVCAASLAALAMISLCRIKAARADGCVALAGTVDDMIWMCGTVRNLTSHTVKVAANIQCNRARFPEYARVNPNDPASRRCVEASDFRYVSPGGSIPDDFTTPVSSPPTDVDAFLVDAGCYYAADIDAFPIGGRTVSVKAPASEGEWIKIATNETATIVDVVCDPDEGMGQAPPPRPPPNSDPQVPAPRPSPSPPRVLRWYLSDSRLSNVQTRSTFSYGDTPMVPIVGDWDGIGGDSVGAYHPPQSKFFLTNSLAGGVAELPVVTLGNPGDKPLVGDWDGDGHDDIGVYRPSNARFYLRNADGAVTTVHYGNPNAIPLVGDWDGDGRDNIGVVMLGNHFYLRTSAVSDAAEQTVLVPYGNPGDVPLIGDWNGDGRDNIGVYRPINRVFYFRLTAIDQPAEVTEAISYGNPGDIPLVGDWDGDGRASQGIVRY